MKKKIFVTVGSTYPLDRLIKEIDEIAKNKDYEIFCQIGKSNVKPKNIKYVDLLEFEEMQKKIKWADIIITHAGIGTMIDSLSKNKKLILFPRLKKYGEAIDDHQLEICKRFNKKYNINFVIKKNELKYLIKKANLIKIKRKNRLSEHINKLIN